MLFGLVLTVGHALFGVTAVDVDAGNLRGERGRHTQKTVLGSAFDFEDLKNALKPEET